MKNINIRRRIMKDIFFNTVSVLLVFVVFAVFPMSLEADPNGTKENEKYTADCSVVPITAVWASYKHNIVLSYLFGDDCSYSDIEEAIYAVPYHKYLKIHSIRFNAHISDPTFGTIIPIIYIVVDGKERVIDDFGSTIKRNYICNKCPEWLQWVKNIDIRVHAYSTISVKVKFKNKAQYRTVIPETIVIFGQLASLNK